MVLADMESVMFLCHKRSNVKPAAAARAKVHSIIHVEISKKMHPSWFVGMLMPNCSEHLAL